LYAPEPAAASFRLAALARALRDAGAEVVVITATPPAGYPAETADHDGIEVRRAPVLRDRAGYVRGYLPYLSFDVPALFRMLFARRIDLVVNEPPPTTGVVTRIANGLRRRPYVYYAADIWSDAVAMTTAPRFVVRAVRALERWAVRGAAAVISASDEFSERMRELGYGDRIVTIGNGVDVTQFGPGASRAELGHPYLLYAGTASEVHGAGIFLDAAATLVPEMPDLRLVSSARAPIGPTWNGARPSSLPASCCSSHAWHPPRCRGGSVARRRRSRACGPRATTGRWRARCTPRSPAGPRDLRRARPRPRVREPRGCRVGRRLRRGGGRRCDARGSHPSA
jgi:glycosyltransferase involved in cell wall biosynthesis